MKALLVLVAAAAIGIGVGYARNSMEFRGVEEGFNVYQEVMESAGPARSQPGEAPETNEAEIPVAKLLNSQTHQFGQMNKGETQEHSFLFKNEGTGMLSMKLTSTSCKCTLSDVKGKEVKVAPGQTYPITLKWKSENYAKRFRQSATIQTNDPSRRSITLYVEGVVIQPMRPEPANIVFSNTTASQETTQRIRLYGYKWKDLEIESAEFLDAETRDRFSADITSLSPEEFETEIGAQVAYQIEVTAKKGLPLGPLRQTLRLKTNKETIDIPITGRVTGEFQISLIGNEFRFDEERNQVRLGTLSGDRDVSVELVLSTARPGAEKIDISFDPAKVVPSTEHIQVEILRDKFQKIGRLYQYPIRITIPKDCPTVNLLGPEVENLGRFVINTTHPTEKTVEFYVRFAKAK